MTHYRLEREQLALVATLKINEKGTSRSVIVLFGVIEKAMRRAHYGNKHFETEQAHCELSHKAPISPETATNRFNFNGVKQGIV